MESYNPSTEVISSIRNPKIKNFSHLQKARERNRQNLFVVEGRKEVKRALTAGYEFTQVFYCPDILDPVFLHERVINFQGETGLNQVTQEVYNHIAYRNDVEGIIGWAVPREHTLQELRLGNNPLILVLESVEKPGNLGAILRTADAAGLDALIVCDPQTDIYNPNVVRSSLGAVFSLQVGIATTQEAIAWMKSQRLSIVCTSLTASIPYTQMNFSVPVAIVLGTESTGLSDTWLKASDRNVIIPMHGQVDSLNVSVSAGIMIFEAIRQRQQ